MKSIIIQEWNILWYEKILSSLNDFILFVFFLFHFFLFSHFSFFLTPLPSLSLFFFLLTQKEKSDASSLQKIFFYP